MIIVGSGFINAECSIQQDCGALLKEKKYLCMKKLSSRLLQHCFVLFRRQGRDIRLKSALAWNSFIEL